MRKITHRSARSTHSTRSALFALSTLSALSLALPTSNALALNDSSADPVDTGESDPCAVTHTEDRDADGYFSQYCDDNALFDTYQDCDDTQKSVGKGSESCVVKKKPNRGAVVTRVMVDSQHVVSTSNVSSAQGVPYFAGRGLTINTSKPAPQVCGYVVAAGTISSGGATAKLKLQSMKESKTLSLSTPTVSLYKMPNCARNGDTSSSLATDNAACMAFQPTLTSGQRSSDIVPVNFDFSQVSSSDSVYGFCATLPSDFYSKVQSDSIGSGQYNTAEVLLSFKLSTGEQLATSVALSTAPSATTTIKNSKLVYTEGSSGGIDMDRLTPDLTSFVNANLYPYMLDTLAPMGASQEAWGQDGKSDSTAERVILNELYTTTGSSGTPSYKADYIEEEDWVSNTSTSTVDSVDFQYTVESIEVFGDVVSVFLRDAHIGGAYEWCSIKANSDGSYTKPAAGQNCRNSNSNNIQADMSFDAHLEDVRVDVQLAADSNGDLSMQIFAVDAGSSWVEAHAYCAPRNSVGYSSWMCTVLESADTLVWEEGLSASALQFLDLFYEATDIPVIGALSVQDEVNHALPTLPTRMCMDNGLACGAISGIYDGKAPTASDDTSVGFAVDFQLSTQDGDLPPFQCNRSTSVCSGVGNTSTSNAVNSPYNAEESSLSIVSLQNANNTKASDSQVWTYAGAALDDNAQDELNVAIPLRTFNAGFAAFTNKANMVILRDALSPVIAGFANRSNVVGSATVTFSSATLKGLYNTMPMQAVNTSSDGKVSLFWNDARAVVNVVGTILQNGVSTSFSGDISLNLNAYGKVSLSVVDGLLQLHPENLSTVGEIVNYTGTTNNTVATALNNFLTVDKTRVSDALSAWLDQLLNGNSETGTVGELAFLNDIFASSVPCSAFFLTQAYASNNHLVAKGYIDYNEDSAATGAQCIYDYMN